MGELLTFCLQYHLVGTPATSHAPALTHHALGYYTVIEEIVEVFVEDFSTVMRPDISRPLIRLTDTHPDGFLNVA